MWRDDRRIAEQAQKLAHRHMGAAVVLIHRQQVVRLNQSGAVRVGADVDVGLNVLHLLEGRAPASEGPRAPVWLRRALSLLGPRQLEVGTAALVAATGRSAEHVARECRRWFGKTPTALINEMRLDRAAALLAGTDDPVIQVALSCGFSNLSHFYRLFRARFHATPAAHRAQHRLILGER